MLLKRETNPKEIDLNDKKSQHVTKNSYCVSDWEQFKILPIWYNNYFRIGGNSFLFRDFY